MDSTTTFWNLPVKDIDGNDHQLGEYAKDKKCTCIVNVAS